jgi:transcriptional regulator with XRE-family HTH domain
MDFPSQLKILRQDKKYTQEQLGKIINVSKVSISGYESGIRTPDLNTIIKLADAFSVSIDYLLGRDTKRENAFQTQTESQNVSINESPEAYLTLSSGTKEKLSKVEVFRLEEELEMFRLLIDMRKKRGDPI